eukprot:1977868-Rhodomonas_salina.1
MAGAKNSLLEELWLGQEKPTMLGWYALEQEFGDFGSADDEPIGVGEGSHDGGLSGVWGAGDEGGPHAVGVVDDH